MHPPEIKLASFPLSRLFVRLEAEISDELLPLSGLIPDGDVCIVSRALIPALEREMRTQAASLFAPSSTALPIFQANLLVWHAGVGRLRALLPPHELCAWRASAPLKLLQRRWGVAAFVAQRQREYQASFDAALENPNPLQVVSQFRSSSVFHLISTIEAIWSPANFLPGGLHRAVRLCLELIHRHAASVTEHIPPSLLGILELHVDLDQLLLWFDGSFRGLVSARIERVLPESLKMELLLTVSASSARSSVALQNRLKVEFVSRLLATSSTDMHAGVRAVPSLYRLTGKRVEGTSSYIPSLCGPWAQLRELIASDGKLLETARLLLPSFLAPLLDRLAEVMTSVIQAERDKEKILNRVTKGSARPSDADKVALQFAEDVKEIQKRFSPDCAPSSLAPQWKRLCDLTEFVS